MTRETRRTGGSAAAAAVALTAAPLLIVEDDDALAAVTTEVLTDAGYSVTRAASPHDTLALFARRGPGAYRLVLSDAFTRDDGHPYTWYDRLRAVTRAPIVLWSAAPRARYDDYRARGYAGFLPKPFDLDALVLLMASLAPESTDGL